MGRCKSFFGLALGACLSVTSFHCWAVNASSSGSGKNDYLFIENHVDNEYFVTPGSLDPRFSGANVWTRYSTKQRSLGYMGYVSWSYRSYYYDMWLSNSPVNTPFVGIRCMTTGTSCPSQGYLSGEVIDSEGFYHTMAGSTLENGGTGYATFSPAMYEYLRNRQPGETDAFVLNLCYTKTDYDAASGQRCRDLASGATWRYYTINATKVGHLTLNSTGALAEIWIASDGTPSVNVGSEHCEVSIVGGESGMTCKMVSYRYRETKRVTSSLSFEMVVDTATLGFSPAAKTIKYSGNGSNWYNWSASTTYSNVFTTEGQYVYVFLSKTFFQNLLQRGISITNNDELFTFFFDNGNTSQSGYYQFTASSMINILPKEYGISIVSSDGNSAPKESGNIGDPTPIEFDYQVTVSSSRMADAVTAEVTGAGTSINGVSYCLFTSQEGGWQVPIPAFLSWTAAGGETVKTRNSCIDTPVDMTGARWTQTPWNAAIDDGYYFSTRLKLLFPMDDPRSRRTLDGSDWMGTVNASGEVKVTAKWLGVD